MRDKSKENMIVGWSVRDKRWRPVSALWIVTEVIFCRPWPPALSGRVASDAFRLWEEESVFSPMTVRFAFERLLSMDSTAWSDKGRFDRA